MCAHLHVRKGIFLRYLNKCAKNVVKIVKRVKINTFVNNAHKDFFCLDKNVILNVKLDIFKILKVKNAKFVKKGAKNVKVKICVLLVRLNFIYWINYVLKNVLMGI